MATGLIAAALSASQQQQQQMEMHTMQQQQQRPSQVRRLPSIFKPNYVCSFLVYCHVWHFSISQGFRSEHFEARDRQFDGMNSGRPSSPPRHSGNRGGVPSPWSIKVCSDENHSIHRMVLRNREFLEKVSLPYQWGSFFHRIVIVMSRATLESSVR